MDYENLKRQMIPNVFLEYVRSAQGPNLRQCDPAELHKIGCLDEHQEETRMSKRL